MRTARAVGWSAGWLVLGRSVGWPKRPVSWCILRWVRERLSSVFSGHKSHAGCLCGALGEHDGAVQVAPALGWEGGCQAADTPGARQTCGRALHAAAAAVAQRCFLTSAEKPHPVALAASVSAAPPDCIAATNLVHTCAIVSASLSDSDWMCRMLNRWDRVMSSMSRDTVVGCRERVHDDDKRRGQFNPGAERTRQVTSG
eukprot:362645-Chlamydomonas_euryale.AAC.3